MTNGHNPVFASATDEELVTLAQSGRNNAFEELMARHQRSARRLALSILRHQQDAEDEVQNAFWKAFEHIGQFHQDSKFTTWLSRIVVNQCLMRLRKDRRAQFLYLDDGVPAGDEIATLELADERPTPETALGRTEVGRLVMEEVRRIPPLLRDVIMLRDLEQVEMPDVASRLGISVAAAKSRLLRARLELRSRMSRHAGRLGLAGLGAEA
jgi:RNA polymerase sigma-70 factor, ECF subfamily